MFDSRGAPELRLLLLCARSRTTPDVADETRALLGAGIDWPLFRELVQRHHMAPLVARHFAESMPALLSDPVVSALILSARWIAQRNVYLTNELLQILRQLESEGIRVMPIKGPSLAVSAFGNLALREFGDLDILVRSQDLRRGRAVLESMGFRPQWESMSSAAEAAFIRSEHAFQYIRDKGNLVVEIHWRLQDRYSSFPLREDELWACARSQRLFGTDVRTLSPEHLILYLCMHGAKHYWERLEWIASLAGAIRCSADLRWPVLLNLARRARGMRILRLGTMLAHALDASDGTFEGLQLMSADPVASDLTNVVWKHIGSPEMEGSQREAYRCRFYLKSREDVRDRLRVIRDLSLRVPHPDSEAWNELPLPQPLWFLYYVFRPIQLARKFGVNGVRGVISPRRIPDVSGGHDQQYHSAGERSLREAAVSPDS